MSLKYSVFYFWDNSDATLLMIFEECRFTVVNPMFINSTGNEIASHEEVA